MTTKEELTQKIKAVADQLAEIYTDLKKLKSSELEHEVSVKKEQHTASDDPFHSGKCEGHFWDGKGCQHCSRCVEFVGANFKNKKYTVCKSCKLAYNKWKNEDEANKELARGTVKRKKEKSDKAKKSKKAKTSKK